LKEGTAKALRRLAVADRRGDETLFLPQAKLALWAEKNWKLIGPSGGNRLLFYIQIGEQPSKRRSVRRS
jgi:hypothetical protein